VDNFPGKSPGPEDLSIPPARSWGDPQAGRRTRSAARQDAASPGRTHARAPSGKPSGCRAGRGKSATCRELIHPPCYALDFPKGGLAVCRWCCGSAGGVAWFQGWPARGV